MIVVQAYLAIYAGAVCAGQGTLVTANGAGGVSAAGSGGGSGAGCAGPGAVCLFPAAAAAVTGRSHQQQGQQNKSVLHGDYF